MVNTKSAKMSESEMCLELVKRVGSTAHTEVNSPIIPVLYDVLSNILDRLEAVERSMIVNVATESEVQFDRKAIFDLVAEINQSSAESE